MYFTSFKKEYLSAVAQLEASSYPEEIAQGLAGFEEEMQEPHFGNLSIAGFSKGRLVCYVTAYRDGNPDLAETECIYISDINCPNPAYLKRLLLAFFAGAEADAQGTPLVFSAHMRSSSYRLLQGEKKRKNRGVKVLDEQWMSKYYLNGEGTYKVRFTVDYRKLLSWQDEFQLWIDQAKDYNRDELLTYAFQWFYAYDTDRKLYDEKNKRFVLNCIKEALLDYYAMFSERIPIAVIKALPMRITDTSGDSEERYVKTIKTYESYGYSKEKKDKQYYYNKFRKCLVLYSESEVYHTRHPEQLSGIRWFWRQQMGFWEKRDASVFYFNRYGVTHPLRKVPYLTRQYYQYLVDKMYFIRELEWKLKETCDADDLGCFRQMCNKIYYLLPGKESRECIETIVSRRKAYSPNYFHDWNLCVLTLTEAKHILTAGAVKRILTKSYNQALRLSKCIESIMKACRLAKEMGTPFDRKTLRKEFSSLIRRDKECTAYANRLYTKVENRYRSQLKLPTSREREISEFVERMGRYNPFVSFSDIFRKFGAKTLKKFIIGDYPCIFASQEISLAYPQVGDYVERVLKQRTRSAKRLYQNLLKKGLLFAVLNREMTREQCGEVLESLKFYNLLEKSSSIRKIHDFKIVVEPKGSPEFLAAGDATVCCMSFGSQKAKVYAEEKGFGILNVYYRDRIIANSVIWVNEPYKCLVLDNIEVHPNYTKHNEIIKECFLTAARKLTEQYGLKFAVQGRQYNDLVVYEADSQVIEFAVMKPEEVKTGYFYTDARVSRVICQNMPEQEFETLINNISEEIYIQAA